MKVVDFASGVGAPDSALSNQWAAAVRAAESRGPVTIVHLHLQASDGANGPVLGESVSKQNHLLLVLSGSVRVYGGGRNDLAVDAGKGVYWPREEGYLVSAITTATALLISGSVEINPFLDVW